MISDIIKPMIGNMIGNILSGEVFFTLRVNTTDLSGGVGASAIDQYKMPLVGAVNFTVKYKGVIIKIVTDPADNIITFPDGGGTSTTFEIRGVINGWFTSVIAPADAPKLLKIVRYAQLNPREGFAFNFSGCVNLTITAPDLLNLRGCDRTDSAFQDTLALFDIPTINDWDWSDVRVFFQTFMNCPFNTYHGDIDVSNVTDHFRTYLGCVNYNQRDNFTYLFCTNFVQYRFNNFAYNQVINMHIPSATNVALMLRGLTSQAQNVTLTGTNLVQDFSQMAHGWTAWFASGAILSIDSFKSATDLSNFAFGTQFQTSNWSDILVQLDETIVSEDNPIVSATKVIGTTANFEITGHPLQVGYTFSPKDMTPAAFNGDFVVTSVVDANHVKCELLSDPLGDATIIGTYDLPLNGLSIHGGSSLYNATGETARNNLTGNKAWTVVDGGLAP